MPRSSNVVKLQQPKISPEKKYQGVIITEDVMDAIRVELDRYDLKEFAEVIGVTKQCLVRIVEGKTVWPRPNTFNNICAVCGIELRLYKNGMRLTGKK